MKRIFTIILAITMLLGMVTTAVADDLKYGVDNLNDKSGNLVIGYIGGSITEGSGSTGNGKWTNLVTDYYEKKYPEKNVTELNAGIGGTGSAYGILRIKNDLKLDSKKEAPDVVFIEFTVNDATGASHSPGKVKNVDSLVRQLLNAPKIPAIVFVYATKASGAEYEKVTDNLSYSIDDYHTVAEHYGIHEINVSDYIWSKINDGEFIWRDIAIDSAHPNNTGYGHYGDCIINSLEENPHKAYKKIDPSISPACDDPYGDIEEFPIAEYEDKYVLSEGFTYVEPENGMGYLRTFFDQGWYETEDATNESIEFEFRGVGFGITTSRTKNNANINYEIYDMEDNLVKTGKFVNYYKTDGNRCFGWLVETNLPYDKYKVVLKGELNQQSVDDFTNSAGLDGGTGKYLAIEGLSVLYPTEAQKNPPAAAEEEKPVAGQNEVVLGIGKSAAIANGNKTFIDKNNKSVVPKVENGRTLVPVRFIAESFNAEVGWNENTKIITINYNGIETRMKLGLDSMRVGDKTIKLDVPVKEENGRTLLPLRAICEEVLGKVVFWDDCGLIVISDEEIDVNAEEYMAQLTE